MCSWVAPHWYINIPHNLELSQQWIEQYLAIFGNICLRVVVDVWMNEQVISFIMYLSILALPVVSWWSPRLVDMSTSSDRIIHRVILVSIHNHVHAIHNTVIGVWLRIVMRLAYVVCICMSNGAPNAWCHMAFLIHGPYREYHLNFDFDMNRSKTLDSLSLALTNND